jgi:hypothetical protein
MLSRAAAIEEAAYGEGHLETADTRVELAMALHEIERGNEIQMKLKARAGDMLTAAIAIFERELGPNHSRTLRAAQVLEDWEPTESGARTEKEKGWMEKLGSLFWRPSSHGR